MHKAHKQFSFVNFKELSWRVVQLRAPYNSHCVQEFLQIHMFTKMKFAKFIHSFLYLLLNLKKTEMSVLCRYIMSFIQLHEESHKFNIFSQFLCIHEKLFEQPA